jgi:hypothetical protein
VFASVSVLNVNTKLVPADKCPRAWDLVRDPYWVDLIKRSVWVHRSRIANIGVYHVYGLKEVNAKEYGEAFIREFAGLGKPALRLQRSGEVARGSPRHARRAVASSTAWAPCRSRSLSEPGCQHAVAALRR